MANEKKPRKGKKNEKVEPVETTEVVAPLEPTESARGERGEVGTASAGLTIRQLWHAAHFTRKDAGDKDNFRKRIYVPNPGGVPSLKQFARQLLKAGDAVAKEWFANKRGAKNEKRSDKNQTRINLEKIASKAARRKKGQSKQGKAAPTDAAATATAGKK